MIEYALAHPYITFVFLLIFGLSLLETLEKIFRRH